MPAARDQIRIDDLNIQVAGMLVVLHEQLIQGRLRLNSLGTSHVVSSWSYKVALLEDLLLLLLEQRSVLLLRIRCHRLRATDLEFNFHCVSGLLPLEFFASHVFMHRAVVFLYWRCLTCSKELVIRIHSRIPSIEVIHVQVAVQVFILSD